MIPLESGQNPAIPEIYQNPPPSKWGTPTPQKVGTPPQGYQNGQKGLIPTLLGREVIPIANTRCSMSRISRKRNMCAFHQTAVYNIAEGHPEHAF